MRLRVPSLNVRTVPSMVGVRDDVWPVAAVNRPNRQNHRLEGIDAAALDRLEGTDAFGGHEDGINAFLRHGGMGHFSFDGDLESIRRGLGGAGAKSDLARLN